MCDYSLHAVENRLAVQGERLVVHRFRSGSIGMAPAPEATETMNPTARTGFWRNFFRWDAKPDRPVCAVCIPPGAKLLLHSVPARLQRRAGVGELEGVTFTQLTARENTYRDAVRFHNGFTVLLQQLQPGQIVEVLSLSSEETLEPTLEEVAA